jgi:hypothetical protein
MSVERPNVIYILGDDHRVAQQGWPGLQASGVLLGSRDRLLTHVFVFQPSRRCKILNRIHFCGLCCIARRFQLEKRNKRLTAALAVMAVAICAVVTMGFRDDVIEKGRFINLSVAEDLMVFGKVTVLDSVIAQDVRAMKGQFHWVRMNELDITTLGDKGVINLRARENGGIIDVENKTGEKVVQLYADEYGNGVVGAWNRKGKGRTLQPGP